MEEMKVTPWEVSGSVDYEKLMKDFGLRPLKGAPKQFSDCLLFRRGIVYAHRDFERIVEAVKGRKNFVMMTGCMPSGPFHFGHKVLADQMIFYQSIGAKVYIAVADVEAYNSRLADMNELRKIAVEEYMINYIALGLDIKKCDFYFQSSRSKDGKKSNAYYSLAGMLARHCTFSEFEAVYGDITPGKMFSSLLQAADMLHPQLPVFGGQMPVVVPVGSDQDAHIRLARDLSQRVKASSFIQLSSTYHKFLPGLKGGKMSSSDPTSFISLSEAPEEAAKKIIRYAFSGGRNSIEEHRKLGGNPDIDVSFQLLLFGLEESDKKLQKIRDDYSSGSMLTGELKQIVIEKLSSFLKAHQKKRGKARKQAGKFLEKS